MYRLSLLLLVALTACQISGEQAGVLLRESSQKAADLLALPVTLTEQQTTITLQAEAWVNMMPGAGGSSKRPLNVLIKVNPGSSSVTPQKLFIIQGQKVWETPLYRKAAGEYEAKVDGSCRIPGS